MNLMGANSWRWIAKPVAEGKFLMKFPTAKMVTEWGHIKCLTMRSEAQIKIEPWSPAVGAKGVLQSSWFRVSKIPADQRSIRTLAKVGGLVGKVIEVDEGSRYRYDYVRLRIACRDVTKVPKTAEGILGMYLIDFGFEREIPEEGSGKMLKSGIKVGDKETQPPQKKSKVTPVGESQKSNDEPSKEIKNTGDQNMGKQVQVAWSAPPKTNLNTSYTTKLMGDAQKAYKNVAFEDGEKVHIPDTLEDSDSESDSFTQKLQQLTADAGQSSGGGTGGPSKIWIMDDNATQVDPELFLHKEIEKSSGKEMECSDHMVVETNVTQLVSESPEIFIPDDSIMNSQESTDGEKVVMNQDKDIADGHILKVVDVEMIEKEAVAVEMTEKQIPENNMASMTVQQPPERSERLKKETNLNTQDKLERMAKKNNGQGLYSEEEKAPLEAGVDTMLNIALALVDQERGRQLLLEDGAGNHQ